MTGERLSRWYNKRFASPLTFSLMLRHVRCRHFDPDPSTRGKQTTVMNRHFLFRKRSESVSYHALVRDTLTEPSLLYAAHFLRQVLHETTAVAHSCWSPERREEEKMPTTDEIKGKIREVLDSIKVRLEEIDRDIAKLNAEKSELQKLLPSWQSGHAEPMSVVRD
jgi:hypothetical protein